MLSALLFLLILITMLQLTIAAFLIGLASSGHCLTMCGGITCALSGRLIHKKPWQANLRMALFHVGRVVSYSLLGILLGSAFFGLSQANQNFSMMIRLIAILMIFMTGLHVAGFSNFVLRFGQYFDFVWRALQPWLDNLFLMQKYRHAFALGLLWVFMPCGMIYSTLLWASGEAQGPQAGILMFAFGLGTLPSLLLANIAQQPILKLLVKYQLKRVLGLLLMAFALVSLWTILPGVHDHHAEHGSHEHSEQMHEDAHTHQHDETSHEAHTQHHH